VTLVSDVRNLVTQDKAEVNAEVILHGLWHLIQTSFFKYSALELHDIKAFEGKTIFNFFVALVIIASDIN
jgi:hypothetical protein